MRKQTIVPLLTLRNSNLVCYYICCLVISMVLVIIQNKFLYIHQPSGLRPKNNHVKLVSCCCTVIVILLFK